MYSSYEWYSSLGLRKTATCRFNMFGDLALPGLSKLLYVVITRVHHINNFKQQWYHNDSKVETKIVKDH